MTQEVRNHSLIFLVIACTFVGEVVWATSENVRVAPLEKEISKIKETGTTLKLDYLALKKTKDILESEVKRLILKNPPTNKNCQNDNPSQLLESQLKIIANKNNQLVLDLKNCIADKPTENMNATKVNISSSAKLKPIEYKQNGLVFSLIECSGSNSITCKFNITNTSEEVKLELKYSRNRIPSRAIDLNGKSYKILNLSFGGDNWGGDVETTIPKKIKIQGELYIEDIDSDITILSLLDTHYDVVKMNRRLGKKSFHKAEFRNIPINSNN